ncbi:18317_t:CDS:2 [Acaulospora morrowiae]|uniref:18317_t:CDS:1 n=1 Tax=Acaulospora morrowiae TaxID=94023 RepID=A0A9N9FUG5_9GLOM|nr:18317_t:CDS:2 [Acaulospora morrowiae]
MAYCFLFLLGRLTLKFFFGELRVIESQHMYDRLLNFLLFKVVFVGAILEPKWEELLIWTTWFTILGFLRIFSMLCRDRFEYLTFSPNTPVQAHLRILSLLILILISDIFWFIMCISIFRSMLLLLTFECFTLFLDTVQTLVKYVIHLRDLSRQGVWESRRLLLYYTEFVTDTLILIATLGHYLHIMLLHGISFTLIDAVLFLNMRSVFNNLRKKIAAYCNYRQAISHMQNQYPDATDKELTEYNDDCAICRDSMTSAKRLPCFKKVVSSFVVGTSWIMSNLQALGVVNNRGHYVNIK